MELIEIKQTLTIFFFILVFHGVHFYDLYTIMLSLCSLFEVRIVDSLFNK